jgi:type II secretion system protein G
MFKKTNKGFTLIELMVTIAIIGILSSIVMISVQSAKQQSKDAKRVSDINSIKLALNLFYNDKGYYPANLTTSGAKFLVPNYMSVIPKDPTGTDYFYVGLTTGSFGSSCDVSTRFHLAAKLDVVTNANLLEDWDNVDDPDAGHALAQQIGGITFNSCGSNGDFYGKSQDCNNTAESAPDLCYDVINN